MPERRPSALALLQAAEALLSLGDNDAERVRFRAVSDFLVARAKARRGGKKAVRDLTPEEAADLFTYDPETGIVARRVPSIYGGPGGRYNAHGYHMQQCRKVYYMSHRIAWAIMTGAWPVLMLDHIDGDPANNRWSNLREVTHSQNQRNRRRSRLAQPAPLGATWHKGAGKWRASIKINDRSKYLGLFETAEAAAEAYAKAKAELFPA